MSLNHYKIEEKYSSFFNERVKTLTKTGKVTPAIERDAQKHAIKRAILHFFKIVQPEEKRDVWALLYSAHVARKAGIHIAPETITKVISADQSWKKSSGHAFEEAVKELGNIALEGTGIEIILQRDIKGLVAKKKIKNEVTDLKWLTPQIKSSVFDLFTIKDGYIFGCIQAKTSIRDRVTRDREPSLNAMNHFFWSIVFVLDGDFLKLPKFQAMVNGGTDEFEHNGWHALYAFSLPKPDLNNRINLLDSDLDPFKKHAIAAANEWFTRRQWFNKDWKPNVE